MYEYANSISSTGRQNIRNYVSKGGGYIGVCGGAYYASNVIYWRRARLPVQSLGIFLGSARFRWSEGDRRNTCGRKVVRASGKK